MYQRKETKKNCIIRSIIIRVYRWFFVSDNDFLGGIPRQPFAYSDSADHITVLSDWYVSTF